VKHKKACKCDWHKEYKFLQSLQQSLKSWEYQRVERYFEEKWMGEEALTVAQAKLSGIWPGYKMRKAITDMYNLKWIDNLTYIELLEKAGKLPQ
jgi:hypothetical protein